MSRPTGSGVGGVLLLAAIVAGGTPRAAVGQDIPEKVAYCLMCHEDQALSLTTDDGASFGLYVNPREFLASVHGSQLICTDCHAKYDDGHPSGKTFASRRAYVIGAYATCKECHFDTYTRTLESVHYELVKAGVEAAPVCTDCHGSHNIQNPHAKRAMVSRSCATCHTGEYQTYLSSVHGRALAEEGNLDVPACADCHTHHEIQQPDTARFRLSSPETCARCHGDEALMAKYGIPVAVAQTYLSDFHGVTASLTSRDAGNDQQLVVTCSSCHGVHDIASPRLLGEDVMKAKVATACSTCHEGASPDFPAAWLSHYTPSMEHAPVVYVVDLFYRFMIPFIVIGLLLHVMLQVYRMSAGR